MLRSSEVNKGVISSVESSQTLLDDLARDEVIYIDSLEIEFSIDLDQYPDLGLFIQKAFAECLREYGIQGRSSSSKSFQERDFKTETPNGKNENSEVSNRIEDAFLYFLETGRVYWFENEANIPDKLIGKEQFQKKLKSFLLAKDHRLDRLVSQFSFEEWSPLIAHFAGSEIILKLADFEARLAKLVTKQSRSFGAADIFRKKFRSQWVKQILKVSVGSGISFAELLSTLFQPLSESLHSILTESKVLNDEWRINFEKFTPRIAVADKVGILAPANIESAISDDEISDSEKGQKSKSFKSESAKREDQNWTLEGQKVDDISNFPNAGLILIHPFLSSLFENLGYLENREFLNLEKQERAACLLYYVATGRTEFPEYEMTFCKYLSGLNSVHTISKSLCLSQFEMDEANSVLSSAIANWPALKNTSIDGLRVNFLQRTGALIQSHPGVTLHVESQAFDILLDMLPWNLALVKLPWLDSLITVKWR